MTAAPRRNPTHAGVSPAQWEALRTRLIEWTGLDFTPRRAGELQQAMAGACEELGARSLALGVQRLLDAPPSPAEIRILAQHLTVGETYFFRDPKAMEALACDVLPALVAARRGGRHALSIWSAGCCTGEEPYSLAMMMCRLLPQREGWDLRISGTDINPAFIEKGRAGVYGEWSFRGGPHPLYKRYFRPAGDGRTAVVPEVTAMVSLAQGNLAADAAFTPAHDGHGIDLILCRNVLMYFSAATMERVVARLRDALAPGGLLLVSPSEASDALFAGFTPRTLRGVRFYEKAAKAATTALEGPFADLRGIPATTPAPVAASTAARAYRAPAAPRRRDSATQARAFANTGRLGEARASCVEWIAADPLDAAARYTHAMVLRELGEREAGAAELGKAAFLDGGFIMAHMALGRTCLDEARPRDAQRHFNNAQALLRKLPRDEAVPEADGLNAGQLLEVLAAMAQPEEAK